MNVSIQITSKSLLTNQFANQKPLMREISLIALAAIKKNIEDGIKPDNKPLTLAVKGGSNTLRDRGLLRRSLNARHGETEALVATQHPAARVHNPEDGRSETVIRSKNGKSLCIPASAMTRTFQRRYGFEARKVIDGLKSDGWFVFRALKNGRPGNVIFAQNKISKRGGSVKLFPLFILKKSVTIPARPFMFLSQEAIEEIEHRIEVYV